MSPSGSPTLEQLRIFAAVVDAGSFSAAAKRLNRTQPVISYAIAAMEEQCAVTLFERGRRRPVLTDAGAAILSYARRICLLNDELRATADNLVRGLEGVVTVSVDSFLPSQWLVSALTDFAASHPSVVPNVVVEARDAVLESVVSGASSMGVSAADIAWPPGIEARDFGSLTIVAAASPSHPLAQYEGEVPTAAVRDSIQITNKPKDSSDESRDVAINSTRIWRIGDVRMALEVLRAGVGWGYLPLHLAQAEIEARRLVQLSLATRSRGQQPFALIHRADTPLGLGGRALADRLLHHAMHKES